MENEICLLRKCNICLCIKQPVTDNFGEDSDKELNNIQLNTSKTSTSSNDTVVEQKQQFSRSKKKGSTSKNILSQIEINKQGELHRPRNINKQVVGTLESDNSESSSFQAEEEKIWIHVDRCKAGVQGEAVKKFLEKTFPGKLFTVDLLRREGCPSFKVGAPYDLKEQIFLECNWPKNIIMKPFKFFRQNKFYRRDNRQQSSRARPPSGDIDIFLESMSQLLDKVIKADISDHYPLIFEFMCSKSTKPTITSKRRRYNSNSLVNFYSTLIRESWHEVYVADESSTKKYNNWITTDIKQQSQYLRDLYALYKQTGCENVHIKYKNEKKSYRKSITDKKKAYNDNIIIGSRNRTKSAWSLVNRVKGKSPNTNKIKELNVNGIKIASPHKIANEFANHFSNNNRPIGVNSQPDNIKLKGIHTKNLFFKPTTPHEVFDIIQNLPPKSSTGLDGIPTMVVKKVASVKIDYSLKWSEQITTVISKMSTASYLIGSLRDQVSVDVLKMIYHAYVQSVIDYSIVF
nr:unnamed protein product [Callosobruchus analis]